MTGSGPTSEKWGGGGREPRGKAGPRVLRSSVIQPMHRADAPISAPLPPLAAQPEPAHPRRYALITPCRDESKFARRTLDAVLNQTARPAVWVIVDDGSKDQTPAILAEYAAKVPWIKVVRRGDRGDRKLGGGVIEAFYAGYDTLDPRDF